MSQAGRASRRLATILFLDIVGSTQIAAELGDRRWRELLDRFRSIVRTELKRHRGHEEDTAGDGFFITFAQPAEAVRAAVSIVGRVHDIGLDVRCGLHFGEAEMIDGRRGGIAVHLGSRVMSLARAAEVLMTTTVRDLITGTETALEDAGTHELKGVPGSWQVWRLRALEGAPLPGPMDADQASARRAGVPGVLRRNRRRRLLIVVAGLLGIVVVAGAFALVLAEPTPPTIVKIDPSSNTITLQVTDQYRAEHYQNGLWSVNGALWQAANHGFTGLVRRDMRTGSPLQTIPVTGDPSAAAFGFGSIWIGGLSERGSVDRWDAVTGKRLADLEVDATIASMDVSRTAVWVLSDTGKLFKIDPIENKVVGTYDTPTIHPGVVVALGEHLWVCDCEYRKIVEFDPVANTVVRTMSFEQAGFLVGLNDAQDRKTVWLLDPDNQTVTPIDVETGKAGRPIGIGANLHAAAVSFGSLWVARGDKVLRIDGSGAEAIARISMPKGFSAGAIAADPDTRSLWIGDCGCPIE
jgi:class 3 adenylate cyclase/DNA-binding beta-propeller fold protein YncE